MQDLDMLYRDIIFDHASRMDELATLEQSGAVCTLYNPACGDVARIIITLEKEHLTNVSLNVSGCAICKASGSILLDLVLEKPIDDVNQIINKIRELVTSGNVDMSLQETDAEALGGVVQFPNRVRCAMLAWNVLEQAIDKAGHAA